MNVYQPPHFSQEKEDALLQKTTIVFDIFALCSLYELTDYYRLTMISVFSYLKDRIWISCYVKEYL